MKNNTRVKFEKKITSGVLKERNQRAVCLKPYLVISSIVFTDLLHSEITSLKIGKFQTTFYHRNAYQCYIRDNFTCYLCGAVAKEVLFATDSRNNFRGIIMFPTKNSWLTVDHIIRRREGGNDHMDNLKTCCAFCNGKRD